MMTLPVLFVLDRDSKSLDVLLSDLARRFGNDFGVTGKTSQAAALAALQEMATADVPVALLLVDVSFAEFLSRVHDLYPRAARVLLVDRDYSSTSPAVQAIALGHADYHLVRPWTDDEMMYRAIASTSRRGSGSRRRTLSCFGSLPPVATAKLRSCAM